MKVRVKMPKRLKNVAEESVKRALSALAAIARDKITTAAQTKLKTSAQTYLSSLSQPVVTDREAVITLNGPLANMMEKGTSSFDLKKMLKGRPYVDIAFRHGAPGSKLMQPMPKNDFNLMRMVAASAKKAGVVRGPRQMPTGPATVSHEGFGKYTHKESKYGSMLAIRSGASKRRQYVTIRRISRKSHPASWIHPGFKPLSLFPKVAEEVRKLAPKVVAEYLKHGIR